MFALGFSFFLVVNMVLARPQQPQLAQQSQQHQQGGQDSTPVPIVSQTEEVGPDGSYSFSFEAGNGISVQEKISQKKNEQYNPQDPESSTDVQVIEGSFQYTAPDGQVINLRYLADENGFQPQGEHLPTAPPALGQQPQDQSQQQQYQGQQQQQYPGQSQQFQGQQQQK